MNHAKENPDIWERLRPELEDYHGFLIPDGSLSAPEAGEIAIPVRCAIHGPEKYADQIADFSEALHRFGIGTDHHQEPEFSIRFSEGTDSLGQCVEVEVDPTGIEIRSWTTAGAWNAIVWLEREMAWRHAPV